MHYALESQDVLLSWTRAAIKGTMIYCPRQAEPRLRVVVVSFAVYPRKAVFLRGDRLNRIMQGAAVDKHSY